jgi:Cytochrome c7 and related cytochrome c
MERALAAILILTTLAAATAALSQSFAVQLGRDKGPVQPISFRHSLHADTLGMDCLYCHTGADRSAIANIPAVSTCMGCHKIAAADRPEVMKLTEYWERGEAVPWVEVYRLPDHVKFNHKRHVQAGVECATCHGPVEKMGRVYQYSSLKMGWCITCHRANLDHPTNPASMDCLVCHH